MSLRGLRVDALEAGAAVADMGVLLPITAALVLTNGVDAAAAFVLAGVLFVCSGLFYRVPVPVQPIKAAAAIAIATRASPQVIAAAGLVLGVVLLGIALTGTAHALGTLFPKPVIRGNQLGVGVLLVIAAWNVVRAQPGTHTTSLVIGLALVSVLAFAERARRVPVALVILIGGVAWSLAFGQTAPVTVGLHLPGFALPGWRALATATTVLVIPQLPLTLGNAIVGTADIEHEYYGERARRVTVRNLLVSCGAGNIAVGMLGGMPLCHGSSGATAYKRFGARTGGVNLVAGGALIIAGALFGRAALGIFALIPPVVLGALLTYTGLRHALLVSDQRGSQLAVALAIGIVGALARNLAIGMAVGYLLYAALAYARRRAR